jgi:GAF domain-containing protein
MAAPAAPPRVPLPQPAVPSAAPAAASGPPADGPTPAAPRPPTPVGATSSAIRWTEADQLILKTSLASCTSFQTVLSEAVRVIGSRAGWDAAIGWTLDPRSNRFAVAGMWCRAPGEMAAFETAMWQTRQDPEHSTIGKAAAATRPEAVSAPGSGVDSHLGALGSAGLATAVLVPLRHDQEALGVLELCTAEPVSLAEPGDPALEPIAAEIVGAHRRVADLAAAPRWTRTPR